METNNLTVVGLSAEASEAESNRSILEALSLPDGFYHVFTVDGYPVGTVDADAGSNLVRLLYDPI